MWPIKKSKPYKCVYLKKFNPLPIDSLISTYPYYISFLKNMQTYIYIKHILCVCIIFPSFYTNGSIHSVKVIFKCKYLDENVPIIALKSPIHSRYKLLPVGRINNKGLLCSTGNCIQYPVINHNGKEYEKVKVKSLSRVRLLATLWTVALQAPLSMGFSRQEYWSGLPFPSPGDLPNPGIKPGSPALQADALSSEPPGKGSPIL